MTTLAEERKTSEEDLLSPPRVLEALTGLLGFRHLADEKQPCNQKWCQIQWEGEGIFPQNAIAGQTCNDTDFDFSSFPSLSILKKGTTSGASSEAHFHHKEAVTAHCASLMSRPILVSSDPESKLYEDDQDEDEGFMAQRISDVPLMMQQNLTTAFSALVQSRLRAYATFLARHGLAMAECSETAHELEEGVVGIEQKLEMMRQLGSLVCLEDSETSFHAVKEGLVSEEEEEDRKIALPLRMIASYNILIPTIEGEAERLKISFETLGSITGIFSRSPTTSPLIRVVQLDLDTRQLLVGMKDCAAQIGSKIMNATNVAFSAPLPRSVKQFGGDHYNKPVSTTKRSHIILEDDIRVISPRRLKPKLSTEEEHEDEDVEKIVDSLFDNVDSRVLVPPAQKRARLSSSDDYMNPAS